MKAYIEHAHMVKTDAGAALRGGKVSFVLALAAFAATAAAGEAVTTTNVGGWQLTLSTASSTLRTGSPVIVAMVVSNTTSKPAEFGRIDSLGDRITPSFGNLCVIDLERSTNLPCTFKFPTIANGIPIPVRGGQYGGQVGPASEERFTFDLKRFWSVTNTGTYRVTFRGRLPVILQPGKAAEFETAPLVLELKPEGGH